MNRHLFLTAEFSSCSDWETIESKEDRGKAIRDEQLLEMLMEGRLRSLRLMQKPGPRLDYRQAAQLSSSHLHELRYRYRIPDPRYLDFSHVPFAERHRGAILVTGFKNTTAALFLVCLALQGGHDGARFATYGFTTAGAEGFGRGGYFWLVYGDLAHAEQAAEMVERGDISLDSDEILQVVVYRQMVEIANITKWFECWAEPITPKESAVLD